MSKQETTYIIVSPSHHKKPRVFFLSDFFEDKETLIWNYYIDNAKRYTFEQAKRIAETSPMMLHFLEFSEGVLVYFSGAEKVKFKELMDFLGSAKYGSSKSGKLMPPIVAPSEQELADEALREIAIELHDQPITPRPDGKPLVMLPEGKRDDDADYLYLLYTLTADNQITYYRSENPRQTLRRKKQVALITSEISEAYEAFRKGKIQPAKSRAGIFAIEFLAKFDPSRAGDPDQITVDEFINLYNSFVKGTMAEELADIYIRVCDAVGGFGMRELEERDDFEELVNIKLEDLLYQNDGNQALFWACLHIIDERIHFRAPMYKEIACWVAATYALANRFDIDIQTHVRIKSIYNSYRGYKHGKDF